MIMPMTKRLQIPVEDPDLELVRSAAMHAGLPMAEWARSILRAAARRELGERDLQPQEALDLLFSLEAPIDDLGTMIEQSVAGRLR